MIKKIAIIGASSNPEKFGNIILKDLLAKGFQIYPVNPHEQEIDNLPVYPSINELPAEVELLVFVVPPPLGLEISKTALERGFRRFWFQPGAGSAAIGELLEQQENIMLVMDRCIMVETGSAGILEL